ncbi:effector-associated constant component EACC1 [Streptomyces sp. bgisy082]|uniref:effector-associated constant component EACC1 n=1 Tax=Streptomyces sp. bgisy082 TaxID=3413776 RepID=UPI003D721C7A
MGDTVIVTVSDGDEQQLVSLYEWLRQSPRVIADSKVTLESDPVPGTLGERADRINLSVASAFASVQIIIAAITLWQEVQENPAPVNVKVGTVIVQVDGAAPDDIKRITDALSGKGSASSEQER